MHTTHKHTHTEAELEQIRFVIEITGMSCSSVDKYQSSEPASAVSAVPPCKQTAGLLHLPCGPPDYPIQGKLTHGVFSDCLLPTKHDSFSQI